MFSHRSKIFLESFINYEKKLHELPLSLFRIERMRRLLDALNNPQRKLNIIHVAGSKGKGSTCLMTANILKHAGYKVGLYTSPHLNHLRERVRVLSLRPREGAGVCVNASDDIFPDMITEEELCQLIDQTKPSIEKINARTDLGGLTFFEVYTALALCHFYQEQTDFVVLETGLGGRLDATNAVDSSVCALTPISLEHTHILGDTVEKIAEEKAAIIKDHRQKVVIAPQNPGVYDVFLKRCRRFDIEPLLVERDTRYDVKHRELCKQVIDLKIYDKTYEDLVLSLVGPHQQTNAACAVGTIHALQSQGIDIPSRAVFEGLASAYWPGRFEVFQTRPLVILDGAHNQESVQALITTLQELKGDREVTLIVGVSNDKDKKHILGPLAEVASQVIATKSSHPRAGDISSEELKEFFPSQGRLVLSNPAKALEAAFKKTDQGNIILGCGSLYLVSDLRREINSGRLA